MKRSIPLLLSLSALFVAGSAGAEEGRFDAQVFRPAAAPRDLVMVQKSEVIGHFSPTAGFYYDVALNPLELAVNDTGRTMDAVAARLQLTALAGIGFFDLFDVSVAVPFIAWQSSDNLNPDARVRRSAPLDEDRDPLFEPKRRGQRGIWNGRRGQYQPAYRQ